MSIFKSGSIRGRYSRKDEDYQSGDWNRETAYRIGYYLPGVVGSGSFVIGRDGRLSSPEISEAVTDGLIRAGCDVTDIGMIDTPGVVFSNIRHQFTGSIMVTASHNPPSDNGLKISGKNGLVISGEAGLKKLEKAIENGVGKEIPGGSRKFLNIHNEYLSVMKPYMKTVGDLKCIIDCSNGMASVLIHKIVPELKGEYLVINDEIDGNFPSHGPNPTIEKNLEQLKTLVLSEKADIGICFDGDGDRMIVVDETGRWVSPDLITAFLGLYYFRHFPEMRRGRDGVLFDARSTNSIGEYITELGGKAHISSTGHTAMQVGLPALNGIYGGELPGHYYYSDFYNLDNGWIPFLQVLAILNRETETLSGIIDGISRYHFSGEVNFDVPPDADIISLLQDKFASGKQTFLDGVRVDFNDWWFLVRMANTEPVLRLVVEAKTPEDLTRRVGELKALIYQSGGTDHTS